MTDDRWQRVKALFQDAVERPVAERDAFLATAAGDDEALRREVRSLLDSDGADVDFLDRLPCRCCPAAPHRPVRRRRSDRRGLDGRGVSRARYEAQSRGCTQGAAPVVRARSRSRREVQTGSAGTRSAQPSAHRRDLRSRRIGWRDGARVGARRGAHARGADDNAAICPSMRSSPSDVRSLKRLKRHTTKASFIAISSPQISRSPPMVR